MATSGLATRGSMVAMGRSSFSGRKVTIFGSSGFLGRYVVSRLGAAGCQMVLPYRGDELFMRHLKGMGDLGAVNFQKSSIRSLADIEAAVAGSDTVVNLLGIRSETRRASARARARACAPARCLPARACWRPSTRWRPHRLPYTRRRMLPSPQRRTLRCAVSSCGLLLPSAPSARHVSSLTLDGARRRWSYADCHVSFPAVLAEVCAEQGIERLIHMSAVGASAG